MEDQSKNGENTREEQVAPTKNTQNAPQIATSQAPKTLWKQRNPPKDNTPSCIVPPEENYVVRIQVLAQLPAFHVMESEHPYTLIQDFQVLCQQSRRGLRPIGMAYFVPFYFKR